MPNKLRPIEEVIANPQEPARNNCEPARQKIEPKPPPPSPPQEKR